MKNSASTYLFYTHRGEHHGHEVAHILRAKVGTTWSLLLLVSSLAAFTLLAHTSPTLSSGMGELVAFLTISMLFASVFMWIVVGNWHSVLRLVFHNSETRSDELSVGLLIKSQSRLRGILPYIKTATLGSLVGLFASWYHVENNLFIHAFFASLVLIIGYIARLVLDASFMAKRLANATNTRLMVRPDGIREDDMMLGFSWVMTELEHQETIHNASGSIGAATTNAKQQGATTC